MHALIILLLKKYGVPTARKTLFSIFATHIFYLTVQKTWSGNFVSQIDRRAVGTKYR